MASACLETFGLSLFNFLNYIVWLRITEEGSVPEMRIWSILLIISDLKWCIHLSRSLFLYLHLVSILHIGTSMILCPYTTQTLRITWARCSLLSLRSQTRQRATPASYLDLFLSSGWGGELHTSIYDKRDDFNFHITNFPFLSSNIPMASVSHSLYDMPVLAPRMDVLF